MSNWDFINQHRVKKGRFANDASYGFNGCIQCRLNNLPITILFSDGAGWQHVSVSIFGSSMTPSWDLMCKVKDLFWNEDETVIQFHPPKSSYVNNHPGCLHLWRCTDGREFPLPDPILVGIKT